MFYTSLCTLVYAGIYFYKKAKPESGQISLKVVLLLVATIGFIGGASAQTLRFAYFGENLTHYGLRGGVEYNLHHVEKNKPKGQIVSNDFFFGLTLTAYRHPHNHFGFILAPELGWRHIGRRGGIFQAAVSPGLFRSFYEGKTWQSDKNGAFEQVFLAGQWGFLPGVSVGFGRQIGKAPDAPLSWFCNLHYLRQYPYNHAFLHRMALEAGILKKLNTL